MVGVAEYEIHALNAFFHHVVDRVAAAAAHAYDLDVVGPVLCYWFKHFLHVVGVLLFVKFLS